MEAACHPTNCSDIASQIQGNIANCQGKVEMAPLSLACENCMFILRVPVKQRRALLASNPIEE
jgi:hypothetical protein